MIPPPRITRRSGTSVWASSPVESTQSSESSPGIGGRIGNEPVATIAESNLTSSPPSTAIVFASCEGALAAHPLDAVRLEERGDPAGHLRDDAVLPPVGGREVELGLVDDDAELLERVARHGAGSARSAPTPWWGCSRPAGRCRRARAPASMQTTFAPSCAARIAAVYPPGPATENCDVAFHLRRSYRGHNGARQMKLEGIHHVTCITGDAPANVEFYAGHARAAARQEDGEPGRPDRLPPLLRRREGQRRRRHHLLRVPGRAARPRRRRDGAPRRLPRRLRGGARLLGRAGRRRAPVRLDADPRSGGARARARRRRLRRRAADRRPPARSRGSSPCAASPACARTPPTTAGARCSSGGSASRPGWECRGEKRGGFYVYDDAPEARGLPGAGTVHHVAWASTIEDHEAWREKVASIGGQPTPVIDRFYFRSIYFREPSGVLFEIATLGPGLHLRRAARDARRASLAAARTTSGSASQLEGAPDPAARPAPEPDVIFAERPAAGEAEGAFVLVHGRGANEHDLLGLFDALDPERRLHGYCPRGPLSLPPGGAHWYAVPRVGYPDPATFAEGYAALAGFVDSLPHERKLIGGFSQGAVMSFAVGLGEGRPRPRRGDRASPASSRPSRAGSSTAAGRSRRSRSAHGTYDPVIPVEFAHRSVAQLEAAGAEVLYRESPIDHAIDPAFVASSCPGSLRPSERPAKVRVFPSSRTCSNPGPGTGLVRSPRSHGNRERRGSRPPSPARAAPSQLRADPLVLPRRDDDDRHLRRLLVDVAVAAERVREEPEPARRRPSGLRPSRSARCRPFAPRHRRSARSRCRCRTRRRASCRRSRAASAGTGRRACPAPNDDPGQSCDAKALDSSRCSLLRPDAWF